MHKIDVVINSDAFNDVLQAFAHARVGTFRVSSVKIYDANAPPSGSYRGLPCAVGKDCLKLELIVRDHEVRAALEAVQDAVDSFGHADAEVTVHALDQSTIMTPSVWSRSQ